MMSDRDAAESHGNRKARLGPRLTGKRARTAPLKSERPQRGESAPTGEEPNAPFRRVRMRHVKPGGRAPAPANPGGVVPHVGLRRQGPCGKKKETGKCGLCRHSHTYNSGGKPKPAHEGVEQYRGWRTKSRGTRARPAPPGRSGSRGTHTRGRHFSARSPLRIHRMSVRERSPRELARRRSRSAVKQRAPRRTSARDIAPHRVPRSCAPRKCQKQRAPRRPSARHRAGRPHLPGVEARRASRGASAGAAPSPSPLARASRRSSR